MACCEVQKLETKVSMKACAEKFYDVLCNKTHQLPNISPQNLLSVQIHKGQWGTQGSIISWNYLHGKMANSQVQKLETNVYLQEAAEVVFDVFCNKTYSVAKAFPTKIQSIDINEGEWGTEGSIISWKYVHDGKNCVAKEVIGDIDRENYKVSFKVIEGDLLQNYTSFKFVMQFIPKENGNVTKLVLEYEKQNYDTPDPLTMIQLANEVIEKVGAFLKKE
ncbi:hypothetical protein V8G54_027349 [Vigna mungo]|uniref:Bet v I/Major latex protein domain-containing protein n=1 Tax=Vigna mungo TaxID=3915 RepID=A0AAQ3N2J0_VIGMU